MHFTRFVRTPSGGVDSDAVAAVCESAVCESAVVDDDPMLARAQIDTGAHASVTGQIELLHEYRAFGETFAVRWFFSPLRIVLIRYRLVLLLAPRGSYFLPPGPLHYCA